MTPGLWFLYVVSTGAGVAVSLLFCVVPAAIIWLILHGLDGWARSGTPPEDVLVDEVKA